jgi:hypothetical protein
VIALDGSPDTDPSLAPLPVGVQEPDIEVVPLSDTKFTWLPDVALLQAPAGSIEVPLVPPEQFCVV